MLPQFNYDKVFSNLLERRIKKYGFKNQKDKKNYNPNTIKKLNVE